MSIEGRLTAVQTKIEQLLELVKADKESRERIELLENILSGEEDDEANGVKSAQAEIRTLELWRSVVSECLGTLCFVFFVCGVSIPWTGHFPPFLSVAFASALAYGALTYRVFPGAHLNPAFTLALTSIKRVSPLRCLLFLTAQAGGAIAGAALLFGLTVSGYQGSLGTTIIASHISPVQAFGLELILSFVITLTFVADTKNSLATTAMLLAANLVALPCTGAGLNPARSLGPAFVMNKWPSHWVFWLGPILGSLMAAYLHKFILRRVKKTKKVRENPSDGDSLDIPSAELPTTAPDRLLCERFEPLYGGTRSLYMKPSPVLPRTNLSRSQSVYTSKRFNDYVPKFDLPRKQATPHSGLSTHSHGYGHGEQQSDSNYESLYERKSIGLHALGGHGHSLLHSGPPSYESGYCKTYDAPATKSHHHPQHLSHNSHSHSREKSESQQQRENHANRILAQYEPKSLVDVESKTAKSQNKASLYYETEFMRNKELERDEKNLMDTDEYVPNGGPASANGNPPPTPRFRMHPPIQSQQRYRPSGQSSSDASSDFSRENSVMHKNPNSNNVIPKKPYELLEAANLNANANKKLLDFTPIHPAQSASPHGQQQQNGCSNNYSPRLLLAEKDSTYSRILEPIMNSKPGNGQNGHPSAFCRMSPKDTLTYSYH